MTQPHLHSTLVRFYGPACIGVFQFEKIYIPHWLDSMAAVRFVSVEPMYLHSTLVRFYDIYPVVIVWYSSNLHSTLVRFYVSQRIAAKSCWIDLHSTLVRFYVIIFVTDPDFVLIYIPHWLDSMMVLSTQIRVVCWIYIPHWLDSMLNWTRWPRDRWSIYIPHWLDSMVAARHGWCRNRHLHSTLVRFYENILWENEKRDLIYIPHWLDSMLNSVPDKSMNCAHLHSTLVRFYVIYALALFGNLATFTFHTG